MRHEQCRVASVEESKERAVAVVATKKMIDRALSFVVSQRQIEGGLFQEESNDVVGRRITCNHEGSFSITTRNYFVVRIVGILDETVHVGAEFDEVTAEFFEPVIRILAVTRSVADR